MPQRIEFSQENFDYLMETVFPGVLTPHDDYDGSGLPALWLYPDEDVSWIGQVDVNVPVFGRVDTKYGTFEVIMGISPYRIIFFKLKEYLLKESKSACRSYWFDVDFEDNIWMRGKKRKKKEYVSLKMSRPNFKKGVVSQTIDFTYLMKQKTGKEEKSFNGWPTCEINSIKWFDRQSKKFVGRKAENVYKRIIEAYENSTPVTATELVLLFEDPAMLEAYLSSEEEVEGKVLRAPAMNLDREVPAIDELEEAEIEEEVEGKVLRAPAPTPVEEPEEPEIEETPAPAPIEKLEEPKIEEAPTPAPPKKAAQGKTCPTCNHLVRPTALFCGNCGERFDQSGIVCPGCSMPVEFEWKACPTCGHLLPFLCPGCRKEMEPRWKACVYCGHALAKK